MQTPIIKLTILEYFGYIKLFFLKIKDASSQI